MKRCIPFILKSSFVLALLFLSCSQKAPRYWPENGAVFEDKSWEIPVADSLKVLVKEEGHWILPELSRMVSVHSVESAHRKPELKRFQAQLGRVSQEIVYDRSDVGVEFYRFQKGRVFLLGVTNPDTMKPLTVFDPPLEVWSSDVSVQPGWHAGQGTARVWNASNNEFLEEENTRIVRVYRERGNVRLGSRDHKAVLCDMIVTQVKNIPSGEIPPDSSNEVATRYKVLMVEGIGPVLEWGIRVRMKENADVEKPAGIPSKTEPEMELYIEVTVHNKTG